MHSQRVLLHSRPTGCRQNLGWVTSSQHKWQPNPWGKGNFSWLASAEQGMGRWVMGQMGHEIRMGHMGHGSLGVDPWPISFFNSMAGLIYCSKDDISRQSVMHLQLCMWLTKSQVHVHIQVHASRAAAGTRVPVGYPVMNYLGNYFLTHFNNWNNWKCLNATVTGFMLLHCSCAVIG